MIFTYCKNDTKQTSLFNKIPTGLVENKNKIPTYWVENKNFSQNFVFALKVTTGQQQGLTENIFPRHES